MTPASLDEAFSRHRPALTGHCYRLLGSAADADDAVQDAFVRAWRSRDQLRDAAATRAWLYRIATRVCLDRLADHRRRVLPLDVGPAGSASGPPPQPDAGEPWLEPLPDVAFVPTDDPGAAIDLRRHTRLAWVAALQALPARQRAALVLREVVGCDAAEVAEVLDTTVASVNSAVQRARATLASGRPAGELHDPADLAQAGLLARYVDAFERYDVDALKALFRDDVALSMPPYALWLRGPDEIAAWFLGKGVGCRGSRLVRTEANGMPAFGQYRPRPEGGHAAWALIVLTLVDGRVAEMTSFLDVGRVFPRFGLPPEFPAATDESGRVARSHVQTPWRPT